MTGHTPTEANYATAPVTNSKHQAIAETISIAMITLE